MSRLFHKHSPVRIFFVSGCISILVLGLVAYFLGLQAMLIASLLVIIELTFSFDNAIVNAKVLSVMSPFWQRMFMTLGIVIAVFGMRIIFPILIVMLTAGLHWTEVINLAFKEPHKYAEILEAAHSSIAAFGGMFLLMLALHFFFDASRKVRWFAWLEKPLQTLDKRWLPALICSVLLIGITFLLNNGHSSSVLLAGLAGIIVYLAIEGISGLFSKQEEEFEKRTALKRAGLVGFASFIYLEVLDASFSFDGVIGAFAVTNDVILIAAGLGVGALWVRSLTLFIVRKKVLHTYRYLEHAAHYVIAVLSGTLLIGLFYDIPEMFVGVIGVGVIIAAVVSSKKDNKKDDVVKL